VFFFRTLQQFPLFSIPVSPPGRLFLFSTSSPSEHGIIRSTFSLTVVDWFHFLLFSSVSPFLLPSSFFSLCWVSPSSVPLSAYRGGSLAYRGREDAVPFPFPPSNCCLANLPTFSISAKAALLVFARHRPRRSFRRKRPPFFSFFRCRLSRVRPKSQDETLSAFSH